MRRWETALWLVLAVMAAYVWYWLYSGGATFLGGVASTSLDWTDWLFGYFATLVGVVAGAAYRSLHSTGRTQRITNFKKLLADIFRSRDLWAGVVASPLVFGMIYRTVDGITLSGLVVVALENGFCCHTVIARIQRRAK